MYRQPNETRKQFQIILYWDCWTSAQAEGQTLTIINDVSMDLHRLPPANRITVKRPANGSLGVFWCMCLCACLHAYHQLNARDRALLLVMSYNENVERMLALTYHKKSANMSKLGENAIWLLYKTASHQRYSKDHRVTHNREQGQS